jgi:NTP pyrophosphatase (non-canonical NTP hydrolase)
MNKAQKEVLLIAQEECAEVTQAISKIFRFGIDGSHNERTNRERLMEELGDLHCMIEFIVESGLIDRKDLLNASGLKRHKLLKWSNIFDKETEDV